MLGALVCAIVASMHDHRRRRLPNKWLGAMALFALGFQALRPLSPLHPLMEPRPAVLLGAALAVLSLTAVELLHRRLRGVPGLGFGDIKLMGALWLLVGSWALPASAAGLALGAVSARRRGDAAFAAGPWITGGAVAVVIVMHLAALCPVVP